MFILPIFLLLLLAFGQISCQLAGRVIGGKYAAPGQFPHQISLVQNRRHYCGGSIISKQWILTAGHCAFGKNAADFHVIAGTTDLLAGNGKIFKVSQLIAHPKFQYPSHDYDLGLIKVSTPIPLGGPIQNITLVPANFNYTVNTNATISGFGRINNNNVMSTKLQYANVPLWDHGWCKVLDNEVTDRMICAGHISGQVSSCNGDSGGPLSVNGQLLGVVSWGFGCGKLGPGIYASVAELRSWIQQVSGV